MNAFIKLSIAIVMATMLLSGCRSNQIAGLSAAAGDTSDASSEASYESTADSGEGVEVSAELTELSEQETAEEYDGSERTEDGKFVFHGRTIDIEMNDKPFGLGLYVSEGAMNEIREDNSPYICIKNGGSNDVMVQYAFGGPEDTDNIRQSAGSVSEYGERIEILPYESNNAGQKMLLFSMEYSDIGERSYAAIFTVNEKCAIYANVNLNGVSEREVVDLMRSISWQEHELTESAVIEEDVPNDKHYVCDGVSPKFEMDILGEAEYLECLPGGFIETFDENIEEQLLVVGNSVSSLGRNGCSIIFTARHVRDSGESFEDKVNRVAAMYSQPAGDREQVYRCCEADGVTMHLFTYLIPDDERAHGTGGTTAWVMISEDTCLELSYVYAYKNAERFEKRALESLTSVRWR